MQNWSKIDPEITTKSPRNTRHQHGKVADAGAVGEQLEGAVARKAPLNRWVRGGLMPTHIASRWHQLCNIGANHLAGDLSFTSWG